MPENVLIVDIKAEVVCALVFNPRSDEMHFFETPLVEDLPDALKDALGVLLGEMEREDINCDFSRVMLGLSPDVASLRVITLPFTESRKVDEILPFELSDSLVENIEDVVIGSLPLSDGRTMAVSVGKSVVQSAIDCFDSLGMGLTFVGLSLFYKDRILRDHHGDSGIAALIDSSSIVVIKDSVPVFYSYISDCTDLKFALASLGALGTEVESFYATEAALEWLEALGLEGGLRELYSDDNIGTLALLRLYRDGFNKDPMNLRKGQLTDKRVVASTRKSLRLAASLIVLLASFWSANVYLRMSGINRELVKIEDRLERTYSELFTDESVVDPLYQMEIKIKELSEERVFVGGGIDVLGVLKGLGDGARVFDASAKLTLFEVKMHSERVVARGEAGNFDNADKFKDMLLATGVFNDISLTDVKKKSAGRVSFSIALTLEDGK